MKLRTSDVRIPKDEWQWRVLAKVSDLTPTDAGTTSVAVRYGDSQIAIFHVPKRGYYATQQMCPHKRAFVLVSLQRPHFLSSTSHTIYIGTWDHWRRPEYRCCLCVLCVTTVILHFCLCFTSSLHAGPLHKRNWDMKSGDCLNDNEYSILAFDVKVEGDGVLLLLPESDELDAVIGSSKWMVRQATAEMFDRGSGGGVEIVGPDDQSMANGAGGTILTGGAVPGEPVCGNNKLEW